MHRIILIVITIVCAIGLGGIYALPGSAQQKAQKNKPPPPTAIYNPYPPGILPPDLDSEVERVLREIDVIEARALARWRALPPPNLTGQPPILKDTGTEMVETLG